MLTAERFGEFFQAVHGCEPFPWQQRLLETVVRNARWPSTLSLPTGAGKTAVLDVAVFALACGAKVPRRTLLVVDRRIVVDDAYRRAGKIRQHLIDGEGQILREVRDSLMRLGGASAVETALLRGGIYREDNWVRDPLQPLLVCSTVDQVGSRLLHRGYGVSPHAWSIHAGLLANDALIVLDEAHTSEPFRQTLEWIERYRKLAELPLDLPFGVVSMTATPRANAEVFALDDDDRCHPVLARRLGARKILHLEVAPKPKDDGLVDAVVERVKMAIETSAVSSSKTILVVLNRVRTARAVATEIDALRTGRKNALLIETPLLLTGRSRSLERDALLDAVRFRVMAGRDRAPREGELPLVVVATQCVEVGADLDADVLISEICPIDSLRQRLGRLDRMGELGISAAYLIAPRDTKAKEGEESADQESWRLDPVYGDLCEKVWKFLRSKMEAIGGEVDVGIAGWESILSGVPEETLKGMRSPSLDAPVMFPAYCDLWVQTSPEPSVVPDPALFLHGPQRTEAEVQIIWRADLDTDHPESWASCVSACPPVVGEALRIPLAQARQWLEGKRKEAQEGSDLEGEAVTESSKESQAAMMFLRWRGNDDSEFGNDSRMVRPGDTVVVPSTHGGCDEWGWNPEARKDGGVEPVKDLADQAHLAACRTPVLRLHPSLRDRLPASLRNVPLEHTDSVIDGIEELIQNALDTCDAAGFDPAISEREKARPEVRAVADSIAALGKDWCCEPHPSGIGWILTGSRRMGGVEFAGEDDGASHLGRRVPLAQHLEDVGKVARGFASRSGLSEAFVVDAMLSGELHDLGKADPAFQALLHGGSRLRAATSPLLAKSPQLRLSRRESEQARRKSGYPIGARHELLSVRLAESSHAIRAMANDWELVLHLVASHHGRCRPFAPVVEHPSPRPVRYVWKEQELTASSDGVVEGTGLEHLASGVAERFWRLVRRYGWWGLSYLEACLRLADWRASALEEKGAKP
jgi:CRISPR-associated endonuclease/helicase Cas3